ncbi:MAG: SlyX family protein [Pseudomonadales bacterium]|nr:SlyX family protein [Pseudomonadales bacterium]
MQDDRFEALETKLLYQEDTIQKLDDALIDQQKQILELQLQIKNLFVQIKSIESQVPETDGDDRPPHY